MSEYKLEIKQIVDYPRCRIYRQFIRCLMSDRNIRTGGSSGLFYYTVLCSYANFRTSYKRIDGISYTVFPGEWICRLSELKDYLRLHTLKQTVEIMEKLQAEHYIKCNLLGRGKLIKFKIENWHLSNRVLEYNAPCQKDTGFFFLPVSIANELVGNGRCSEMDAVLDLWINTVYNDDEVKGSEVGPLVYKLNEEKSKFVASRSFDETLERLIVRGLVAEGCGKTDREALYNLISGLYIIPLHQSLFIRTVSFIRMIMLYNIPYEKAKVLFCKDKKTKSEKKIMELAFSAPMLTAEIVECIDRKIDFIFSEDDVLDFLYADSSVKSTNIADKAHILPSVNSVIADISNLYLRKQILFERL